MNLITNNPYRIAGILSNATERELQKQRAKIKAYTRVGKEIKSDFDFEILDSISRTEESVSKAFSKIEQNQDKVDYALFWFLNASPFDNTAFEYLKNGDEEKAIEIWEKVTTDKDVNSKNFSAFNNLGTYKLLSDNKSDIKSGIEAKIKLIESDYFENFVHSVADETYTIDKQKQSEKLIDELLTQFKNPYSSSETMQLFSGCNAKTQQYLSKKFTEEPLHNIEAQIETCKKKRKASKRNAYEYGLGLYTNTKEDLSLLKSLLSIADLKYKAIADQLANEIMQCGIDYFNVSQENNGTGNINEDHLKYMGLEKESPIDKAEKLSKLANSIAVGKLTKDRANDSLETLADMKDREVNEALQVLNSIKNTYDKNAQQFLAQVKEQEINMAYGQSINWGKVAELIKDSINWNKAVELLLEVIPRENISKIKNCPDPSKVNDYKKLVEFVFEKVSYSQKSKIQYLQYWEVTSKPKKTASTSTRTTPRSTTSSTNTSSTSNNDGCSPWVYIVAIIVFIIIMVNACS